MHKLIFLMALVLSIVFPEKIRAANDFDKRLICRGAYYAVLATTNLTEIDSFDEKLCFIREKHISFGDTSLFTNLGYDFQDGELRISIESPIKDNVIFFKKEDLEKTFDRNYDVQNLHWGAGIETVKAVVKKTSPYERLLEEYATKLTYEGTLLEHRCFVTYLFKDFSLVSATYVFEAPKREDAERLFVLLTDKLAKKYNALSSDPKLGKIIRRFEGPRSKIAMAIQEEKRQWYVGISYKEATFALEEEQKERQKEMEQQQKFQKELEGF